MANATRIGACGDISVPELSGTKKGLVSNESAGAISASIFVKVVIGRYIDSYERPRPSLRICTFHFHFDRPDYLQWHS
jgi:hypothetical protein